MDIRLNRLSIRNFQGIKEFEMVVGGKNASIFADNAKGKTTIYNAFTWLISGKDSFNRADFGIKPLDEEGNEIHFLETEVEAELLVDGKPLKMKKILTENWVKPRGQTEQEYKGNNTAYFFDEVPMGATQYKAKVDELIGEEVFRLLTNPLYFNQHYKLPKLTDWQSRRALLFEMCGDISDETIIQMNPNLAKLPEVLDGKSIDDRKAIIAQTIKKLNEQIVVIGPKINENMRLIPEIGTDYTATEQKLSRAKAQLEALEKELTDAGNVAQVHMKKQQELFSLKNQLENVKSRIFKDANKDYQRLTERKRVLESEKFNKESLMRQHQNNIESNNIIITANGKERELLIAEWKRLSAELQNAQTMEFVEPDEDFTCPTCKQELPADDKEKKIAELRANFETQMEAQIRQLRQKIDANVARGKDIATKTTELKALNDRAESIIQEIKKDIEAINAELITVRAELDKPTAEPDYSADAEYNELSDKIKELEAELNKPVEDISLELRAKKNAATSEIEDCNRILNNKRVAEEAKARIEELKQQEKDLSVQKSQLEGQLNLITEFIKAKANTLTDIMNSKFKHVKFELFETQINGNMVECCNTLVNTNGCWVPFADGNTAGRINAGIDIVNALSEHYGVRVPLWVDNRESITDIAETNSQVISLIKPDIRTDADRKKYSKLNVEVC
jgi:exonuclease SbcC